MKFKSIFISILFLLYLHDTANAITPEQLTAEEQIVYKNELKKINIARSDKMVFRHFPGRGRCFHFKDEYYGLYEWKIYKHVVVKETFDSLEVLFRAAGEKAFQEFSAARSFIEKHVISLQDEFAELAKTAVNSFNAALEDDNVREKVTLALRKILVNEIARKAYYHKRKMLYLSFNLFFGGGDNSITEDEKFRMRVIPDISLTYYFRNPYNTFNWGINASIGYDFKHFKGSWYISESDFGYINFSLKLALKVKSLIINAGTIMKIKIRGFDYKKSLDNFNTYKSNKTIFGLSFDIGFLLERENLNYGFLIAFSTDLFFKSMFFEETDSNFRNGILLNIGIKLGFTLNLL